eukprot:scaffold44_cov339-Pavlova_lutheri.AAC.36
MESKGTVAPNPPLPVPNPWENPHEPERFPVRPPINRTVLPFRRDRSEPEVWGGKVRAAVL